MKKIALKGRDRINWNRLRGRANSAVVRAIKSGSLTNLKKFSVGCVDCGARATQYDHRDYEKPLVVEPVCAGCNVRRGTNAPLLKSAVNFRNKSPQCPKCSSKQVLFTKRKGKHWCRLCGHEWKGKSK